MTAILLLLVATASAPAEDSALPSRIEAAVPVPEASPKAMRYYHSGLAIWWIYQASLIAVPAAIVVSGLSARMRNLARRIGRSWVLTVGLFGVMYAFLNGLILLPLDYYAGFVRPKEYGLSADSYGVSHWLLDEFKELCVTAGLAFGLLWLPYLALRKMPRSWPWIVAVGTVPIAFAMMFLDPIVIDPMFNKFGPMRNKDLEIKIVDLAARAGIDGGRVFEVDKGTKTKAVNAYVKGFGGTHRIVLWDTLTNKLSERQVLFVMGHEMGHYVLGHVNRSLLLGAVGVLALTLFLKTAGSYALGKSKGKFGFDRLDDVASLPLALVLGNAFVFAFSPVGLAYSRHQEHEADRFALELTHDNRAGAEAFVTMQAENLSNPRPGPLVVFWRSTHPSLADRIEFCNHYRPWQSGIEGQVRGESKTPAPVP